MRRLTPLLTLCLVLPSCGQEVQSPGSPVLPALSGEHIDVQGRPGSDGDLTVMTWNIYVGANVDVVLAAESPEEIPVLVAQAFQELVSTNFPERAEVFVRQIAETQPHLIGLQEASILRRQSPGDLLGGGSVPAEDVVFDYLDILLATLRNAGLDYHVAGRIQNADVEVPMIVGTSPLAFDDVRLTDFDVVLARADVAVSRVEERNFQAMLVLPDLGIAIPRGYVAVDATVGSRSYRFVNTHLEPAPIPAILPIQLAQAQELADRLQDERIPVILVGDLNTPAPTGETYRYLQFRDYVDVWTRNRLLGMNRDGFTNPNDSDLRNEEITLHQRIDFILARRPGTRGIGPVSAIVVGDEYEDRTAGGLWPSDHAGVVARLRIPHVPGANRSAD